MGMPRIHTALAPLVLIAAALILSGCTAAPSAPTTSAAAPTAAPTASPRPVLSASPPDGVRLELYQQRSDYGPRRIQVAVVNESTDDLVVYGLVLSSPTLDGDSSASGFPYTVVAGTTVNFPVALPAAVCTGEGTGGAPDAVAGAEPVVELRYGSVGAAERVVRVIPTQPFDSLGVVHTNDCRRNAFESIVAVYPATTISTEKNANGRLVAVLRVRLEPTGAAGTASIVSVGGTILLDVQSVRGLPLTFGAGSRAETIEIRATPTRCDTHVVGEDKVGTILPVTVRVGDAAPGQFSLTLSAGLRNQYLEYVSTACGW